MLVSASHPQRFRSNWSGLDLSIRMFKSRGWDQWRRAKGENWDNWNRITIKNDLKKSNPGDSNVQSRSGSTTVTGHSLIPPSFRGDYMPGSQVVQRIGGGNTGTSQYTMGPQRSPLSFSLHHISLCSFQLPIFLLPEKRSFFQSQE